MGGHEQQHKGWFWHCIGVGLDKGLHRTCKAKAFLRFSGVSTDPDCIGLAFFL